MNQPLATAGTTLDLRTRPATPKTTHGRFEISIAGTEDRQAIYRSRCTVYARELGQHAISDNGKLEDALDNWNHYIVAKQNAHLVGFVSITPPTAPTYSIDKYFTRPELPFPVDDNTYEIRLLTVLRKSRGSELAILLMYAALRWVEAHGGKRIIAIGRQQVMDLYRRSGLQPTGKTTRAGQVTYELMHATTAQLRQNTATLDDLINRMATRTHWQLPFDFNPPASCFHGGAFFDAIGTGFATLDRRHQIINADVLDAWFPPAPSVTESLQSDLPWLIRTSPPTDCSGLVQAIASACGVAPPNILPGAGSSDLIFRALRHWLTPSSRALILDPTYGEYAHVLERVIGCSVDRFPLSAHDNFTLHLDHLATALQNHYDLVVLVNPNSPTGTHVARQQLEAVLAGAPPSTRIWIDETYVEYAGPNQSLEPFAAHSENVIVSKSMSKVYALSGARVAYLTAGQHQLESLRAITPPWVIGLPTQVAAVHALRETEYYAARYRETADLRNRLTADLQQLGWHVFPGIANFLLCQLPKNGPDAETLVRKAQQRGLFLRNAQQMGSQLGPRMLRLAVKDAKTNQRIQTILSTLAKN